MLHKKDYNHGLLWARDTEGKQVDKLFFQDEKCLLTYQVVDDYFGN